MRLRNKGTGEIVDVESLGHAESLKEKNGYQVTLSWATEYENLSQCKDYHSLAELNEEWEDYKPEEPKITDPEWRHVVRKWYELNDLEGELRVRADVKNYKIIGWRKEEDVYGQEIDIPLSVMECETDPFDGIKYTIAELCGEGE